MKKLVAILLPKDLQTQAQRAKMGVVRFSEPMAILG